MINFNIIENTKEYDKGIVEIKELDGNITLLEYFSIDDKIGYLLCDFLGYDSLHFVSSMWFTNSNHFIRIKKNNNGECCLL